MEREGRGAQEEGGVKVTLHKHTACPFTLHSPSQGEREIERRQGEHPRGQQGTAGWESQRSPT